MHTLLTVGAGIVGFAVFVVACHNIYYKMIKPMFHTIRTVSKMIDDVETVPELHSKVDTLSNDISEIKAMIEGFVPILETAKYELNTNGGRSMKDQSNAMVAHINDADRHVQ